jgi:hypothetical protein
MGRNGISCSHSIPFIFISQQRALVKWRMQNSSGQKQRGGGMAKNKNMEGGERCPEAVSWIKVTKKKEQFSQS